MHPCCGESGEDGYSVSVQGGRHRGGRCLERRSPRHRVALWRYGAVDAVGETVHESPAFEFSDLRPRVCVRVPQVGGSDRPQRCTRGASGDLTTSVHSADSRPMGLLCARSSAMSRTTSTAHQDANGPRRRGAPGSHRPHELRHVRTRRRERPDHPGHAASRTRDASSRSSGVPHPCDPLRRHSPEGSGPHRHACHGQR